MAMRTPAADRKSLLRRIRRVEALHAGATTEGERTAAARARARLVERLGGDVPSGRLEPVEEIRFDPLAPPPGAHLDTRLQMPTHRTLVSKIEAWAKGDLSSAELSAWAWRFVDGMLLPDLPASDVDSIRVEVILQLSSLEDQPLWIDDAEALVAFLRTPKRAAEQGWAEWFRYVESVDWHARRRMRVGRKRRRA
jgi:hypothetical protein